jgi:hypothetical protein
MMRAAAIGLTPPIGVIRQKLTFDMLISAFGGVLGSAVPGGKPGLLLDNIDRHHHLSPQCSNPHPRLDCV